MKADLLSLMYDAQILTLFEEDFKSEFSQDVEKYENELVTTLTPDQLKIFKHFKHCYWCHLSSIRDKDCQNVMYECLNIGFDMGEYIFSKYKD